MHPLSPHVGALFEKLMAWYDSQCDGDWEHGYGISIGTIDNPGWLIKINLVDTEWEDATIKPYMDGDSEDGDDWCFYKISDRQFEGACSSKGLHRVLNAFFEIVDKPGKPVPVGAE